MIIFLLVCGGAILFAAVQFRRGVDWARRMLAADSASILDDGWAFAVFPGAALAFISSGLTLAALNFFAPAAPASPAAASGAADAALAGQWGPGASLVFWVGVIVTGCGIVLMLAGLFNNPLQRALLPQWRRDQLDPKGRGRGRGR